ncbi:hypothetical protein HPP92_009796 [Vanilla planifolia]|uniref:Uncharacterized protein n=1 Tax=Vanilla planifolia TaxID=51239 RepID=A0A835R8G4_VANPL|nr:hypothetical protein HPP92_009990 [Vanilla planifolia]KAG0487701.1 hypothetical protein HPP92_009796 [Vanilla planifolia]
MSDGRKISQVWSSFGGVQILVSFVLSSMVPPRSTSQVSLRGASAREISRNALLEKVVHERQLETSPAVPPPLLSLSRFFLSLMISVLVTWSLPLVCT